MSRKCDKFVIHSITIQRAIASIYPPRYLLGVTAAERELVQFTHYVTSYPSITLRVAHHVTSYPSRYELPITLRVTHHVTSYPSRYELLFTLRVTHHVTSYPSRYELPITLRVTHHVTSYPSRYKLPYGLIKCIIASSLVFSMQLYKYNENNYKT